MTNESKKLINLLLEFNDGLKNNLDKRILESYLNLSFVTIENFFQKRLFLIKKNKEIVEKEYISDTMSLLKLLDIRKQMLEHGIDLFYSLSIIDTEVSSEFHKKYFEFVDCIGIYKLNLFRDELIDELKSFNNSVVNIVVEYLSSH